MRQNVFHRLSKGCVRPVALTMLFASSLLVGCDDDPEDNGQGSPLPEGEYPVMILATVEQSSHETADDAWNGGEQVAVEVMSNTADVQSEVKTYTADGDGKLTSDVPFWWTNSAERKILRAWYCGDGSSAVDGVNATAVPTSWSVQADQSGEGVASNGYQASDLLFAPTAEVAFAGEAAVPLKFYHQTAKVVINIKKTETVTDAMQIKAVRIGDENLVLTAPFTAPVNGTTAGTWATDEATANGTIIPRKLDTPTEPEYVASYEAFVIPQPTTGKHMVVVETDFSTMYYTALDEDTPLEAGKVCTYNISLDEEEELITGIKVTGNTWKEGELVGLATDKEAAAYIMSNERLVPKDAHNPLWWSSKTSPIAVVGWYAFGMSAEYAESRPEIFTVQTDQSTEDGVKRSDFLYAKGDITYGGSNSLAFKHCLTKLRVNVTYKDVAAGSFNWKYPFLVDGIVGVDGMVTADENGSTSVVQPMKLTTPYGDYDETFEFMLPVQFLKGSAVLATYTSAQNGTPIELKLPGNGIQLKTGVAMAIEVVISPLQITVGGSISWGEGDGGSGSVEL